MSDRDRFRLVGRETDCHVIEGDGTRPISEENVRVLFTDERVKFPPEIGAWRREIEEEQRRREAAGEKHAWNNERFAVTGFVSTRTHTDEEPVVTLSLSAADYYDFMATSHHLDRVRENGLTLRQEFLEHGDPVLAPAYMSCSFGVNIAVETGVDRKMLFSFRSGNVEGRNRRRWNSSANEGLARKHDLPADGTPISLHAVARRALKEELAVLPGEAELELLGFGLDLRNHQWAAFFRAVLPGLGEDDLRDRWSKGVEDKWEHERHAFVPGDARSVLEFIAQEPAEAWTPCAPALFHLALVRAAVLARGGDPVGRLDVEAAERAVMRDHPPRD
ncbi:translation initiation factor 2 [Streptomyces sp. TRM S81-3]|uniref:Translation initiation factor 2 n=1 Tax=Streptomyces griseicoloratus TaxID=2752516 RepID=A0A926KXF2_9ACTN|nr:translation initiation factor 2 [Streptomyces griseicoloratus]MBD0418605.1 translation initiation factor 2 [Streptomyces griseicoloratus]